MNPYRCKFTEHTGHQCVEYAPIDGEDTGGFCLAHHRQRVAAEAAQATPAPLPTYDYGC